MKSERRPEAVVAREEEQYTQIPRHVRLQLGEHALEEFIILDSVDSPFEDVRKELEAVIIEQPAAIDAIIDAVERSQVRLPGDNRPIANLAFLGPTGVGKSETAKVLAELLEEGSGNLVKIDCSNFSNGYEVAALIGSPPGYVGREQEPALSKLRVEEPGTVILFDEVEKGSQPLYNLMLQIMGDGELRLNDGELVSFRETVVILTSNLGAKEMSSRMTGSPVGFGPEKHATDRKSLEQVATKSFEEYFTPEFVNRINKKVVFHPLSIDGLGKVLDTKLSQANAEYEAQFGARISLSDATRTHLIDIAAKEPHLGARPLVRALEDNIQTTFGRYIGADQIREGTHIRVFHYSEMPIGYNRADNNSLIFTAKHDPSIKRRTPPLELTATFEPYNERVEEAANESQGDPDPEV